MPDQSPEVRAAMREWQAVTDDLVAITRTFNPARLDAASACGGWTNRQLLAHMATGCGVRIAALQAVVAGAPASQIKAGDANAANVARLSAARFEDVVAEMIQVRGRVLVLFGLLRPEHLGAVTSLADGGSLREALASLNVHDLEHASELRG